MTYREKIRAIARTCRPGDDEDAPRTLAAVERVARGHRVSMTRVAEDVMATRKELGYVD
jgi:hypothetical protein